MAEVKRTEKEMYELLVGFAEQDERIRPALLQMMAWEIGSREGFEFSLGKNYKFIEKYLPKDDWDELVLTLNTAGSENLWQALFRCRRLFRKYSKKVGDAFDYPYPDYDEKVSAYVEEVYKELSD